MMLLVSAQKTYKDSAEKTKLGEREVSRKLGRKKLQEKRREFEQANGEREKFRCRSVGRRKLEE